MRCFRAAGLKPLEIRERGSSRAVETSAVLLTGAGEQEGCEAARLKESEVSDEVPNLRANQEVQEREDPHRSLREKPGDSSIQAGRRSVKFALGWGEG